MMRFEWNSAKNKSNRAKHGIDFETARLVFDDPFLVSFIEPVEDGEERWRGIGAIEDIIVIVVVHTYRTEGTDEVIRIVPARRATSQERKLYEKAKDRKT